MTQKPSVLLVDDEPSALFGYRRYLTGAGFEVDEAQSILDAMKILLVKCYDAVLLDMFLPDGNGMDMLPLIKERCPSASVIVVTGRGDIPLAVEAMRLGADNFLTKPVNLPEVEVYLKKAVEVGSLRKRELLRKRLYEKTEPYFPKGPAFAYTLDLFRLASTNDSPVLLQGETGTGKGVIARWIHDNGPRSSGQFVEVNCSSLKGDLLLSELFGHKKGAFTSAVSDKQGLMDVADGGTLFLDEIADMDFPVQAQFLKVLEEKSYRRLGDVGVRKSDFRLICATNKDLADEIEHGRFRKDLFFRIAVLPITAPPLRGLRESIPDLARHLIKSLDTGAFSLSDDIIELFHSYEWPGNIRELKNVLERASILSRGGPLKVEHFPGLDVRVEKSEVLKTAPENLRDFELKHIESIFEKAGGDPQKAASMLGVSRATFYRKLKKLRESK